MMDEKMYTLVDAIIDLDRAGVDVTMYGADEKFIKRDSNGGFLTKESIKSITFDIIYKNRDTKLLYATANKVKGNGKYKRIMDIIKLLVERGNPTIVSLLVKYGINQYDIYQGNIDQVKLFDLCVDISNNYKFIRDIFDQLYPNDHQNEYNIDKSNGIESLSPSNPKLWCSTNPPGPNWMDECGIPEPNYGGGVGTVPNGVFGVDVSELIKSFKILGSANHLMLVPEPEITKILMSENGELNFYDCEKLTTFVMKYCDPGMASKIIESSKMVEEALDNGKFERLKNALKLLMNMQYPTGIRVTIPKEAKLLLNNIKVIDVKCIFVAKLILWGTPDMTDRYISAVEKPQANNASQSMNVLDSKAVTPISGLVNSLRILEEYGVIEILYTDIMMKKAVGMIECENIPPLIDELFSTKGMITISKTFAKETSLVNIVPGTILIQTEHYVICKSMLEFGIDMDSLQSAISKFIEMAASICKSDGAKH